MKKLLVFVLFLTYPVAVSADSFERIQGIGKDRERLTPEMVEARTEAIVESLQFFLMRYDEALEAPNRIFDPYIWELIEQSAQASTCDVDPFLVAAIGYVESFGRPDVRSPTGPLGWGQLTKVSAKELGLKTYKEKVKVEKLVWTGKGKNRRQILKTVTETRTVDERLYPAKAIPAVTTRLCRAYESFGRWDFAIQQFHNGQGRIRKMISLYTGRKTTDKNVKDVIEAEDLSYPLIFFDNTPYHHTELYNYLEDIRKDADYAPTYFYRVMQGYNLLSLHQESPLVYTSLFEQYRSPFKDNGFASSRMWYFYTPEQVASLQFNNLASLEEAHKKRLVPLPEPWEKFGVLPRLTGKSVIAEMDPDNRPMYMQAESGTMGMLLYIMNEVKLLQGKNYQPYEVNSLVRSIEYQNLLRVSNANARTELPTHTMGKAVDIPLKGLNKNRKRDLLFILQDMDYQGMLSFVVEGKQDTIHVVPHPEWESDFEQIYWQAVVGGKVTTEINFVSQN